MKKMWIVVGGTALVAVLGAAILGGAVLAQETPTEPVAGTVGGYVEQVWDAIARRLGVERAELDTAVKEARQEVVGQAVEDGKLTEDQAERMLEKMESGPGLGPMGRMFGRMGGMHGHRGPGMMECWQGGNEALADILGMTTDELKAELQGGKTVEELAEEKGVDLAAAQLEVLKENLQQAVDDGKITQDQADQMLQRAEEMGDEGWFGFGRMRMPFGHVKGPRGFGFNFKWEDQDEAETPAIGDTSL